MGISVILGHPDPGSLNHAVAKAAVEALTENGHHVFGLCGVDEVYRRTFSVVVTSTPEERREWLAEMREMVGGWFPAEGGKVQRG